MDRLAVITVMAFTFIAVIVMIVIMPAMTVPVFNGTGAQ